MPFGFAPLMPPYLSPDDLARLQQQGGAGPIGSQPQGLSGSPWDIFLAGVQGGASPPFSFGGAPSAGLPSNAGPPAPGAVPPVPRDRTAPVAGGGNRRVPLTPRSLEGSPVAAPSASVPAIFPAPAPPSSQPSEPSFVDRWKAVGDSGIGDSMLALASGLLSAKGGAGWSAGFQNMLRASQAQGASDLARTEMGLKARKAANETNALNETEAFLKRGGYDDATAKGIMASYAAGDRTALSNAMNRISPAPVAAPTGYRTNPDGTASYIPGGPADPSIIGSQAQARHISEPQLADIPQADGSMQKVWLNRGAPTGTPVGAAREPAPMVREMPGPDGNRRPYSFDRASGQWKELDVPGPPTTGNPYATGKFNETQGKAAGFADRMMSSEGILRGVGDTPGVDGVNTTPLFSNLASSEYFPNVLKSTDRQKMEQAQRDFVNAQLRRESGAAISPSEFENARLQYFAQPGDSAAVQLQKRVARQRAIEAMGREGGPAYRPGSVFNPQGDIVPYRAPSSQMDGRASREALEAEARRRGLLR